MNNFQTERYSSVRNSLTDISLPQALNQIELMVRNLPLSQIKDGLSQVNFWIKQKGFNTIITTGKSGIIAKHLLEGLGHNEVLWFQDSSDVYEKEDPSKLDEFLIQNGKIKNETNLVVVDDYMGTGHRKARKFLLALEKGNYHGFGFAGILGPTKFHDSEQLSVMDSIKEIMSVGNCGRLSDKLFFSDVKSRKAQDLMYHLEYLADHYHYPQIQDFIDRTLDTILDCEK